MNNNNHQSDKIKIIMQDDYQAIYNHADFKKYFHMQEYELKEHLVNDISVIGSHYAKFGKQITYVCNYAYLHDQEYFLLNAELCSLDQALSLFNAAFDNLLEIDDVRYDSERTVTKRNWVPLNKTFIHKVKSYLYSNNGDHYFWYDTGKEFNFKYHKCFWMVGVWDYFYPKHEERGESIYFPDNK